MATILHLEQDAAGSALDDTLAGAGHTPVRAEGAPESLRVLARGGADLVISWVTQPLRPEQLAVAVDQALEIARLRRENETLRRELTETPAAAPRTGLLTLDTLDLETAERLLVHRALDASGGNRTRAAALLGMSVRTLRNKLKAYGVAGAGAAARGDAPATGA